MEEARRDPSLHGDVSRFLRNQNALVDIQKHHLLEQFTSQMRQLRLAVWEKRLGVLLRVSTAIVGLAIAAGVAFMVWQATQSSGLLIEPFSVPPDLAARGLTGEVVATKVLDRLTAMQAQTSSQRAPKSYANSWDERGIKLDVPETGVSLSELDSFLRQKLGHDTHVSGEVVREPQGVSLTARAGGQAADSVAGPEDQIDGLVQRLAESIYRMSQPYRYAVYLSSHDRMAEALPVLGQLAKSGSPEDRPWAYNLMALAALEQSGVAASDALMHKAVAADPGFVVSYVNIARYQANLSHPEQAMADTRKVASLASGSAQEIILPRIIPAIRANALGQIDQMLGAFYESSQQQAIVVASGIPGRWGLSDDMARAQTGAHDLAAARASLADPVKDAGLVPGGAILYRRWSSMIVDNEAEAWADTLVQAESLKAGLAPYPGERDFVPSLIAPLTAYAQARLGRFTDAEATIAATPADCFDCLRARARIAALKGEPARADWWFARAIQNAPSSPFAWQDWGAALLERGKPDDAIAQFTASNQKGPHFADPLEGWGEALMARNQSHLALAKFAEAEKYAPNWGRLQLKWGEALFYAGKKDEARAHFARAAALDLTPDEKAELAKVPHS